MTDTALLQVVVERLAAEPPQQQDMAPVVLAAFRGEEAIREQLAATQAGAALTVNGAAAPAPAAVHLLSIEVEGFRGIGPASTLHLDPGPGLTLVLGRNGSGKSSFAEALELLLTGDNRRWAARSQVWRDGWQNLHHRNTRITARFSVDGRRQPLEVRRQWAKGAALSESTLSVDGKSVGDLQSLGWTRPLQDHPPLLSHNELEHALDEPVRLHDALSAILGLGEVSTAVTALRAVRLELARDEKLARDGAKMLIDVLQRTNDERAAKVIAALKKRSPDVAAVERVVAGDSAIDEGSTLRRLRDLCALQGPDREALRRAAADLRDAATTLAYHRDTDAGRADETAALLQQALSVHAYSEGSTCAVCGTDGVLTFEWRRRTQQRVDELRAEAHAVQQARRTAAAAGAAARRLITAPPRVLQEGAGTGVDLVEVTRLWERWADAPQSDDLNALALHLDNAGPALIDAVAVVRRAADEERMRREQSWQPAATAVIDWLHLGRAAKDAEPRLKRVEAAEKWLNAAHADIRDERFRPIAGAVQDGWAMLRQESNVSLGALQLVGAGNRRTLKLDVTIDGEEGSALGVMSQGELNSLALSLFLPRASMTESPFHFVVIDDPVQAMDPAKVEGLARVLYHAAEQRQVIVLTHDDRLADAVRLLDIRATTLEVTRREGSVVSVVRVLDPAMRYIEDAMAVAQSDNLPAEAMRVVPGLCRLALEAASAIAASRRMHAKGVPYAGIHTALSGEKTLFQWLALGLLGDAQRSGDVMAHLERTHPGSAPAVRDCNRGAHETLGGRDLVLLVRAVEKLVLAMTRTNA